MFFFLSLSPADWCLAWRWAIWSSPFASFPASSSRPSSSSGSSAPFGATSTPSSPSWSAGNFFFYHINTQHLFLPIRGPINYQNNALNFCAAIGPAKRSCCCCYCCCSLCYYYHPALPNNVDSWTFSFLIDLGNGSQFGDSCGHRARSVSFVYVYYSIFRARRKCYIDHSAIGMANLFDQNWPGGRVRGFFFRYIRDAGDSFKKKKEKK